MVAGLLEEVVWAANSQAQGCVAIIATKDKDILTIFKSILFSIHYYIECWEYCSCCFSCCCYSVTIPPPHYQLEGTPNASLSHSPQTVGPHATCHLPSTDYLLTPAPCEMPTATSQLLENIFARNFYPTEVFFRQNIFFGRNTQN